MAEGIFIPDVVSGIANWLTSWAKQQFIYVRDYNTNFDKLTANVQKLKDERSSIQSKVDEARNNGEEIKDNVQSWLERTSKIIDEADKLITDEETADSGCANGCPNLMNRRRLSKNAATIVMPIDELLQEAPRYQRDVPSQNIPEDIGDSFQKKSIDYREDFLQKLGSPFAADTYEAIKLSFDKLENDELQKTLLLIAYAHITSFDELVMYGMGLDLFQGINTMEEAQDRVRASVFKLKASRMLLDGEWGEDFSMDDVVRDVAISIACTEHHVFTARNDVVDSLKWQDKDYTSIVLHDVNMIRELLEVLDCPQLQLLSVRAQDSSVKIPEDCFARMIELKVLHLTQMHSSLQLPPSLRLLTNLQTLCLDRRKLKDVAVIGDLKKVDILCFRGCRFKKLPLEVGQLTQLKSLGLRSCYDLKVIPPNVISSLSNLEELYIGGSFTEWEVHGLNNTEIRNASLDELMRLPNLTCLEIQIKAANTLPIDLYFKKLVRYKIVIGDPWWFEERDTWPEISRRIKLKLVNTNICLNEGHIMLLQGIQDLCPVGSQDMKNILYGLDDEGFPQLKHLEVQNNPNLVCIIDSSERRNRNAFPILECLHLRDLNNLEKICHGRQFPAESFSNSKIIKIERCNKLKTIFPFFIARGLSQLQEIEVSNCENMEVTFDMGGEEELNNNIAGTEKIELSQLCSIKLNSLPQLISFCFLL